MLPADERKQLEAAAATDLRTPANLVNIFVLAALAKKESRLRVQAPPASDAPGTSSRQTRLLLGPLTCVATRATTPTGTARLA